MRDVKSHGYATGNGVADDTDPIQECLNQGPGVVNAPPGCYRLTRKLRVPPDVHLRGEAWGYGFHPDRPDPARHREMNTTFMIEGADGEAAILVEENASVGGFRMWYPGVTPEMTELPPYPPAILLNLGASSVENVEFVGAGTCVVVRGDKTLLRNLTGQPLDCGIDIDGCGDVCRIENVQWTPYPWFRSGPLYDRMRAVAVGFEIGFCDGLMGLNSFALETGTGWLFADSTLGWPDAGGSGSLFNCGVDDCGIGFDVRKLRWDLHIHGSNTPSGPGKVLAYLDYPDPWQVAFHGMSFGLFGTDGEYIVQHAGRLMLDGCEIAGASPDPGVKIYGGSGPVLSGCTWNIPGAPVRFMAPEMRAMDAGPRWNRWEAYRERKRK